MTTWTSLRSPVLSLTASTKKIVALALALALVVALACHDARAESESPDNARATFALIIGSNQSVDSNLTPLRYADDDAARYLDLFRLLGARTYLLARLDDNTKRLHPQAAAEATDPKKSSFDAALAQLTADVTKASLRKVETVVYFVYAGHGNIANGQGYITLEDLRITGNDLATIFAKLPATKIHVIADACASYFLAYSRGPGGERRPIEAGFGLGNVGALANDSRVGLLLSTSSARESHEWDAFQSGVFSHEVRSGLYGAADADGDGVVSYHEIAAFVTRANAAIPNERYRPDVHARAPRGGDTLLDLRRANGRRLEIDGKHAGHYFLEDSRGVRIADVHNADGQSLSLIRPAPSGRTYLRRISDGKEFVIDSRREVVALADLKAEEPRSSIRGAAHESFANLFTLPFDQEVVASSPKPEEAPPPTSDLRADTRQDVAPAKKPPVPTWRLVTGFSALGAGALSLATGLYFSVSANNDYDGAHNCAGRRDECMQWEVDDANKRVASKEAAAAVLYASSAALVGAGLAFLLWPTQRPPTTSDVVNKVRVSAMPGSGGFVGYGGTF